LQVNVLQSNAQFASTKTDFPPLKQTTHDPFHPTTYSFLQIFGTFPLQAAVHARNTEVFPQEGFLPISPQFIDFRH
jgi:hypothetical protein